MMAVHKPSGDEEQAVGSAELIARVGDNSAGISRGAIAELNRIYQPLDFAARIRRVYDDVATGGIIVTSSCAAPAAACLRISSTIRTSQKIHFIDTGYHFAETLAYKDRLVSDFGLDVIDVKPDPHHHAVSQQERMWETDPDLCCQVNKVQPL